MTVTSDEQKLTAIRDYVHDMSPIFRPAIFVSDEISAYQKGYDQAMHNAQEKLKKILDE